MPHTVWKVHALARQATRVTRPTAICGLANARKFTEDFDDVDCHVCLYQLGLFVPLSRLAEHQMYRRVVQWQT